MVENEVRVGVRSWLGPSFFNNLHESQHAGPKVLETEEVRHGGAPTSGEEHREMIVEGGRKSLEDMVVMACVPIFIAKEAVNLAHGGGGCSFDHVNLRF